MIHTTASRASVPGLLALLLWAGNAQAFCLDDLPASNPDSVYTDHGNGTVTDTRTGLMWKQCAEGLSGAHCATGTLTALTWVNALALAEGTSFAGYSDWRLPNIRELFSLVETCRANPAVNMTRFPGTPPALIDPEEPSSAFWSSSPTDGLFFFTRFVDFGSGRTSNAFRTSSLGVRLVRGGQ